MILSVCANPSVDSFWTVDALKKRTINRSRNEKFYPGGKGIHTAFALRELGQKVTTIGVWGGQTGQWLRQQCRQKDILIVLYIITINPNHRSSYSSEGHGPTVKQWNRICITMKSDSSWNETELLGNGPEIDTKTAEDFRSAYKQFIAKENVEAVIMSGSTPRGFSNNLYGWLVEKAKSQRIPIWVDASGLLLKQTLAKQPFGIHINQAEGQELCGQVNPADIAKWVSKYCEMAAITAGKNGLFLMFKDELFHASHTIPESDIFSTIGSGDCLLAGLCTARLKYDNPKDWARFAVACGSANCIHPKLGMLKKDDVNAILPEVIVEKC